MTIPKIGQLPNPETVSDSYRLFLDALSIGLLDVKRINTSLTPQAAALCIQNGVMPDQAGVILDGRAAFDLVAVGNAGKNELHLHPTSKTAVDSGSDKILEPGLITLTTAEGRLRPVALAESYTRAVWRDTDKQHSGLGGIVVSSFGIEAPNFEVHEVGSDGVVVARPHRRIF